MNPSRSLTAADGSGRGGAANETPRLVPTFDQRPLGRFGKQLTSPLVTLVVGRYRTLLHVHEEVLRQIPFFQDALDSLQSGVEMRVTMPDEDPEIVSKMIEFMYKGDYTGPRSLDPTAGAAIDPRSDIIPPPGFQAMGRRTDEPIAPRDREVHDIKLFHAQVYVLGERYGYAELCRFAQMNVRRNLIYYGPHLLEYMVAVYEITGPKSAMRIPNMFGESEGRFQHGTAWGPNSMKKWIRSWWQHDGGIRAAREGEGKLLEAFERCPELARDLLVLVAEVECI